MNKLDLVRLLRALRITNIVILSNGWKLLEEEVMLPGLYELVSGEDQCNIAVIINEFGRDQVNNREHLVGLLIISLMT